MSGSFSIKKGDLEKITLAIVHKEPIILKSLDDKMNQIVEVIYKTATARRPKISAVEAKAMGRKTGKGAYRVSDPDARIGVPVDTGRLQASITKSIRWEGKKIIGEIDAGLGIEYAKMIEFGTSRMRPRPFMRPAWNENLEWIKRKWKEKIEKL